MTTNPTPARGISRRRVVQGIAWTTPAVVATVAAPSYAASGNLCHPDTLWQTWLENLNSDVKPGTFVYDAAAGTLSVTTVGPLPSPIGTASMGLYAMSLTVFYTEGEPTIARTQSEEEDSMNPLTATATLDPNRTIARIIATQTDEAHSSWEYGPKPTEPEPIDPPEDDGMVRPMGGGGSSGTAWEHSWAYAAQGCTVDGQAGAITMCDPAQVWATWLATTEARDIFRYDSETGMSTFPLVSADTLKFDFRDGGGPKPLKPGDQMTVWAHMFEGHHSTMALGSYHDPVNDPDGDNTWFDPAEKMPSELSGVYPGLRDLSELTSITVSYRARRPRPGYVPEPPPEWWSEDVNGPWEDPAAYMHATEVGLGAGVTDGGCAVRVFEAGGPY